MAENNIPQQRRDSTVPRIDFAKLVTASAKKNKNKNRDSKNITTDKLSTRTPMSNHNRTSLSSGLFSPPSSQNSSGLGIADNNPGEDTQRFEQEQDPARMLISPPPEEVLQLQNAQRRASFNRSSISYIHSDINTQSNPSTSTLSTSHAHLAHDGIPPSMPTATVPSSLPPSGSFSKRKRSAWPTSTSTGQGTAAHDSPSSFAGLSGSNDVADDVGTAQPLEATPNPKPRKQSKRPGRAHVRNSSINSDTSMQSVSSPTRQSKSRPSLGPPMEDTDDEDIDFNGRVQVLASTPRNRSSPTKSRNVTIQSPHACNPDADFIPPFRAILSGQTSPSDNTPREDPVSARLHNRRSGRRSATPVIIPPYEPPSEVFTPPREVILSPSESSATKSSRTRRKTRGKSLKLVVKTEAPEIDLSEPMPPASPTDDPLLLSGPPDEDLSSPVRARKQSQNRREAGVLARADEERPFWTRAREESLPPSSPPSPATHLDDEDIEQHQDVGTLPPSSSSMMDEPAPYFNFNDVNVNVDQSNDFDGYRSTDSMEMDVDPDDAAGAGVSLVNTGFDIYGNPTGPVDASGMWTDSDDDENDELPNIEHTLGAPATVVGNGVGEYTGRWRLLQVRTKADPPSSATKVRMDEWGRPISPYPYTVDRSRGGLDDNEVESPSKSRDLGNGRTDSESQEEQEEDSTIHLPNVSQAVTARDVGSEDTDEDEAEEREVRAMSMEPEGGHSDVSDTARRQDEDIEDLVEEMEVRAMSMEPAAEDNADGQDQNDDVDVDVDLDQEADEEREVREMSMELDAEEDVASHDVEEPRVSVSVSPLKAASAQLARPSTPQTPPLRDLSFLGLSAKRPSQPRISEAFEKAAKLFGTTSPVRPGPSRLFEQVSWEPEAEPEDAEVETGSEGEAIEDAAEDIALHDDDEDTQPMSQVQADDDDSADEDSDIDDPGLHDYDCFTKILLKQQRTPRNSTSTLDDLKRDSRRKSLADAGISKNKGKGRLSMATPYSRRQSVGGVIGDQVFIPGSPVTTLGSLLKEAEKEVQHGHGHEDEQGLTPARSTPVTALRSVVAEQRNPFSTPMASKLTEFARRSSAFGRIVQHDGELYENEEAGPREWTKEEWKILDGCFTDERLELGEQDPSLAQEFHDDLPMVGVDMVDVDRVVDRFIELMGSEEQTEKFGWTRESLFARTKAIQNKQRAGHVAPPTTPYTPRNVSENPNPQPSMPVPDFTPLGKRPAPPRKSRAPPPPLPPPAGNEAPFSNIPASVPDDPPRRQVPATLLAPRYSHLLEEAVAVSKSVPFPKSATAGTTAVDDKTGEEEDEESEGDSIDVDVDVDTEADTSGEQEQSGHRHASRPSLGKKVTGFLFSYLPTLSKTNNKSSSIPRKTSSQRRPGLPLPPAEVLEKPRGPVNTPARPTIPKPKPAKDLVDLNHRPFPEESKIPRRGKVVPKRMVELKNVPLPAEKEKEREVPRPRRSSGGSVKDLVKNFEDIDKKSIGGPSQELKRVRSIGDWRKGVRGPGAVDAGQAGGSGRPTWKP
ncbi:hypothetical protein D9758_009569 [Tetrapyrgos nigripes]|uniref:Uncharacterized protein n=1 Tax=Tetrapyrgos nigripes TaxID=182062 RepID=A0A8H5GCR0_9AGAR|nr:hypothetical protein D9758_009569 [Tetrapyrgos nigripes]